jgi:hypothetical protein
MTMDVKRRGVFASEDKDNSSSRDAKESRPIVLAVTKDMQV